MLLGLGAVMVAGKQTISTYFYVFLRIFKYLFVCLAVKRIMIIAFAGGQKARRLGPAFNMVYIRLSE
jgi:hypothetical protein